MIHCIPLRLIAWWLGGLVAIVALRTAQVYIVDWYRAREKAKQERLFRQNLIRLETHDVDRESAIVARKAREAQDDAMRLRGLGVTAGYGDAA